MSDSAGITVVTQDNRTTITGRGELDLSIGPRFRKALVNGAESSDGITVDFREARYIDSAILQALADACVRAKDGRRLHILVLAGSHPDYVLRTVGFDDLMDIEVAEASAAKES